MSERESGMTTDGKLWCGQLEDHLAHEWTANATWQCPGRSSVPPMSEQDIEAVELSSDELTALIGVMVNARRAFILPMDEIVLLNKAEVKFHTALKSLGYKSRMHSEETHQ